MDVEDKARRGSGCEDILPLELLRAVDVAVVFPAFTGEVLDVDGLEGTLRLGPVLLLQCDHACAGLLVALESEGLKERFKQLNMHVNKRFLSLEFVSACN